MSAPCALATSEPSRWSRPIREGTGGGGASACSAAAAAFAGVYTTSGRSPGSVIRVGTAGAAPKTEDCVGGAPKGAAAVATGGAPKGDASPGGAPKGDGDVAPGGAPKGAIELATGGAGFGAGAPSSGHIIS